jgi:hypothetical protein
MEYKFVKKNPVTGDYSVNYVEVNNMMKLLNRAVNTEAEYVAWVRDWKVEHSHIVGSIKTIKSVKDWLKYEQHDGEGAHGAQLTKLALRPFARALYQMRADQKARLKSGEIIRGARTVAAEAAA